MTAGRQSDNVDTPTAGDNSANVSPVRTARDRFTEQNTPYHAWTPLVPFEATHDDLHEWHKARCDAARDSLARRMIPEPWDAGCLTCTERETLVIKTWPNDWRVTLSNLEEEIRQFTTADRQRADKLRAEENQHVGEHVAKELRGVDRWLTLYAVSREWGGPEEGGWWFDRWEPIATLAVKETSDPRQTLNEIADNLGLLEMSRLSSCSSIGRAARNIVSESYPFQNADTAPRRYE